MQLCLLGEKQNDTAHTLTKTLPIILFTMFLRLFLIVFGHFYWIKWLDFACVKKKWKRTHMLTWS